MDSITQVVLGASIGELIVGKQAPRKGLLWGGVAGLIPDLDIVIEPFYTPSEFLIAHRGLSHSFVFAAVLSPLMASILHRFYPQVSLLRWFMVLILGLITHMLLDFLTVYGTGLLEPFSNLRFELPTISIVDPIYSLPLLVSLLMVWFWRSKKSHTILFACFVFSHLYLFGTIANHFYVKSIFEESLAQQDISYEKLIVGPSLMNNILWYGVAIDGDTAWLGLFSHFDSDSNIALTPVDRRLDLRDDAPMESMENLQRFSRGFYLLRQYGDEVVMHDLRFGFIAPEKYLFSFSYDRPSGSPFMGYWHDDFSELFLPRVFGEEID